MKLLFKRRFYLILIIFIVILVFASIVFRNSIVRITKSHAQQIWVCPTSSPGQPLRPCFQVPINAVPPDNIYSPPDSPKIPNGSCTETRMLLCDTCETTIGADPANITRLKKAGCGYLPTDPGFSLNYGKPGCVDECIGKPVLYFYPKKTTLVNVSLDIPGVITISDPYYPPGGWKNVEARPNGTLNYNGKIYKELYYETALTTKSPQPPQGIVIATAQLKNKLTSITTKLGLFPSEQHEFLDYWLPRLKALKSPYIFFSILDSKEKERVDHVNITPKPDTMIEFIAFFKPLQTSIVVDKLTLPQTPPKREGFTVIEWGGFIAQM